MDVMAILDLIAKGVTVANSLIEAGQKAGPALDVILNLVTGAKTGTVTDEQLSQAEAILDGLINDFNLPMDASKG
jgi:hypothetical protein